MKRFISIIIYIALTICLIHAQSNKAGIEISLVQNSKIVRMYENTQIPAFLEFKTPVIIPISTLGLWMKENFNIQESIDFKFTRTYEDQHGYIHYRYKQTYLGYIMEKSDYIVHTKNNLTISMNGLAFDKIKVNINYKLSEEEALELVLNHINAKEYKWQMPGEEELIKSETNNPEATYYPKGELVLINSDQDFKSPILRITYKFNIYANEPLSRAYYFVDAINGEIIYKENIIHTTDVLGTAQTRFSGTQTITTDSVSATEYRLRETGRGNGIETYNMLEGTSYASAVDFTDDDNDWNNVNPEQDEVAADAHWGSEMTYDYYFNIHGRNSIDNNGFKLKSYLHYRVNWSNAFWDGQRMTYGDGDSNTAPYVALDIIAHEITHGLTTFAAGLGGGEAGGLNESFSDIFGTMVEFYSKPALANWTMGEDVRIIRNMANPKSRRDPDTYLGQYWDSIGLEPHNISTVQSHWFYLLSNGGTGINDNSDSYSVDSIGMDKAASIAYRNLTVYLFTSADYYDSRYYSIQAASDLYGECSPEVVAVMQAWYAVGVGGVNRKCDFTAQKRSNCIAPHKVAFQNLSDAFTTYTWHFGDGNSSSNIHPIHTYTSYGEYTVKLVGNSTCGSDSITKALYIKVDSTLPCNHYMPTNSLADTSYLCEGKLFDDGGTENYTGNLDAVFTIMPANATKIILNFGSFAFEGDCNCDWLYIYDGPDKYSPLIGQYSGFSLPGNGTIVSSGGSITIRQYTDPLRTFSGFELDWQCSIPSKPPIADFISNMQYSCSGIIEFTDKSFNSPLNWFWDFGDGTSSILQNPTHAYTQSGIYDVKLIVWDDEGSDTSVFEDYINISFLQNSPTGQSKGICGNGSLTLTASGSDLINWYDSETSETPLDTGTTFTTPFLNITTDYYVANATDPPVLHTGIQDNTTSSGGYYMNNRFHALIFDCFKESKLLSAKIYSNATGNRTIQLLNSSGKVLEEKTINIPDGESRVILDFNLPIENDLQLGVLPIANLYRHDDGITYPIDLTDILSIKKTTATDLGFFGYYYYFFDWEVVEKECYSARTKITAYIDSTPTANFNYIYNDITATFTNKSNGWEFYWDFGDGNFDTIENPTHTYTSGGDQEITFIVSNSCGSDTIKKIISKNSINENSLIQDFVVYPIPSDNELFIKFYSKQSGYGKLKIISLLGKLMMEQDIALSPGRNFHKINLGEYRNGIYFIQLQTITGMVTKRIIIE